jgi:hypothetical protein
MLLSEQEVLNEKKEKAEFLLVDTLRKELGDGLQVIKLCKFQTHSSSM